MRAKDSLQRDIVPRWCAEHDVAKVDDAACKWNVVRFSRIERHGRFADDGGEVGTATVPLSPKYALADVLDFVAAPRGTVGVGISSRLQRRLRHLEQDERALLEAGIVRRGARRCGVSPQQASELLHTESWHERGNDAEPDTCNLFVCRAEHVKQRAAVGGDPNVLRQSDALRNPNAGECFEDIHGFLRPRCAARNELARAQQHEARRALERLALVQPRQQRPKVVLDLLGGGKDGR